MPLRPAGQVCPDPPAYWVDETARQEWLTANPGCTAPAIDVPNPATLLAPNNDATVPAGPITFSWARPDPAVDPAGQWSLRLCTMGTAVCATDEALEQTLSRTVTLTPGTYAWSVGAARLDGIGGQSRSTVRRLTVTAADTTTTPSTTDTTPPSESVATVPVPSAPAPGATVSLAPTLAWSAVAGAASYRVELCNGDACFVVTSPTTSVTAALPNPGTYTWTVAGVRADGKIFVASPRQTFVVPPGPADTTPVVNGTPTPGTQPPPAAPVPTLAPWNWGKVIVGGALLAGGGYLVYRLIAHRT